MGEITERTKALLTFLFRLGRTAAGAIMATVQTVDSWNALNRPLVWIGILIAVEPIITEALRPTTVTNLQTAARHDEAIEARAEMKAGRKIQTLISQGTIQERRRSPRTP
jgi:hypothetical protein